MTPLAPLYTDSPTVCFTLFIHNMIWSAHNHLQDSTKGLSYRLLPSLVCKWICVVPDILRVWVRYIAIWNYQRGIFENMGVRVLLHVGTFSQSKSSNSSTECIHATFAYQNLEIHMLTILYTPEGSNRVSGYKVTAVSLLCLCPPPTHYYPPLSQFIECIYWDTRCTLL